MRALILNCTLKKSPAPSSTQALAKVMCNALQEHGVTAEIIRAVDVSIPPGLNTDEGPGDGWPAIMRRILSSQIVVLASPVWIGRHSSIAQRIIERMGASLSEPDTSGRSLANGRVAGFIATGNEDGAKHVIGEMATALIEIGFTVPGQSWAYFSHGSLAGPSYIELTDAEDKRCARKSAEMAAYNLVVAARAFEALKLQNQNQPTTS